jgi:hypothetical protein
VPTPIIDIAIWRSYCKENPVIKVAANFEIKISDTVLRTHATITK